MKACWSKVRNATAGARWRCSKATGASAYAVLELVPKQGPESRQRRHRYSHSSYSTYSTGIIQKLELMLSIRVTKYNITIDNTTQHLKGKGNPTILRVLLELGTGHY